MHTPPKRQRKKTQTPSPSQRDSTSAPRSPQKPGAAKNRKRRWITALVGVTVLAGGYILFSGNADSNRTNRKPLADVRVPALSTAALAGRNTFNAYCARCHGKNAAGTSGVAPPLVHVIYEPGHHGDIAFYMAVQNGTRAHHWPFGDMPPVVGVSEAQIADIITYIRELQRANGI